MSLGFSSKRALRPEQKQEKDEWKALLRQVPKEQSKVDDMTEDYIHQERQRKAEEAARQNKQQDADNADNTETSSGYNTHSGGSSTDSPQNTVDSEHTSSPHSDSNIASCNDTPTTLLAPPSVSQPSVVNDDNGRSLSSVPLPSAFRPLLQPVTRILDNDDDEISRKFAQLAAAKAESSPTVPPPPPRPPAPPKTVRFSDEQPVTAKNDDAGFGSGSGLGFGASARASPAPPAENTFSASRGFTSTNWLEPNDPEPASRTDPATISRPAFPPSFGLQTGFGGGGSTSTTVSQQQSSTTVPPPASAPAASAFKSSNTGFGVKTGFGGGSATVPPPQPSTLSSGVELSNAAAGFGCKTGFGSGNNSTTVSPPLPAPLSSGFESRSATPVFGSKTGFGGNSTTVSAPLSSAFGSRSGFGSSFGGTSSNSATVSQQQASTTVSPPLHTSSSVGFGGFRSAATEFVPSGPSAPSRLLQNALDGSVRSTLAAAAASLSSNNSHDTSPPRIAVQQPATGFKNDKAATTGPFPWGSRPCFREMLEGGSKKLVLTDPPASINNYFSNQVSQSYGCTYDDITATFFATAPGGRGRQDGWISAMSGDSSVEPVRVASNLASPAAIGIYQPGVSICVVTDRGIFVLERKTSTNGDLHSFYSRQVTRRSGHRGISATAGGGIVSFWRGHIRIFDGNVANGEERVLAEANYDVAIRQARVIPDRNSGANVSFLDVCENKLVISDLGWHCISLWQIDETSDGTTIKFLRAIDVGSEPHMTDQRTRVNVRPGKCAFAAGIRLDREGWVICADASGRTIQIWDDNLRFVCRVEPPNSGLPYISGLYVESDCHLMVCDRRTEFGGLRCYILEAKDINDANLPPSRSQTPQPAATAAPPFSGFAAAARQQQQRRV